MYLLGIFASPRLLTLKLFSIKSEHLKLQVLISVRVVDLLDMLAYTFSIGAFLEVIIDKAFQLDFYIYLCISFLEFLQPVLQGHDLIQTVYIFSKLISLTTHEPFNFLFPKQSHHNDDYGHSYNYD